MNMPETGQMFKFNPAYTMLQPSAMIGEARKLYREAMGMGLAHVWVNENIAPPNTTVVDGVTIHPTLFVTPQEVWCSHLDGTTD